MEEEEWSDEFHFPPPAGSGQPLAPQALQFGHISSAAQPRFQPHPIPQQQQVQYGGRPHPQPHQTQYRPQPVPHAFQPVMPNQPSDEWSFDASPSYGQAERTSSYGQAESKALSHSAPSHSGPKTTPPRTHEAPNLSFYTATGQDTHDLGSQPAAWSSSSSFMSSSSSSSSSASNSSVPPGPSFPGGSLSSVSAGKPFASAAAPGSPLQPQLPNNFAGLMQPAGGGGSLQDAALRSVVTGAMSAFMPSMFIPSNNPPSSSSSSSTCAPNTNPNDPANFADEPPLLEELGIDFADILIKTRAIIIPTVPLTQDLQDHADLSGPLFFALALGCTLLLTGKLHFGYIYGFGVVGSLLMYLILNLMSVHGIGMERVITILGYCLLPINLLSIFNLVVNLRTAYGAAASLSCVAWSTFTATRFVETVLDMREQRYLVAYPILLFYFCFTLLTVY
eukprot:gb/GEZN01006056.1/.p1 GENE.gb/GEZN01006056.1/~~gb/GEZN01006056.1/.p1  ORF type:complete len:449 (-),score=85.66 gb/GEZN01006056.1/:293-1639(-)